MASSKTHEEQRGFTLLELMVVVAILGVIAAMAGPNLIRYKKNSESRDATLQSRTLLRQAQTRAVATGRWQVVVFKFRSATGSPDYMTLFDMAAPPAAQTGQSTNVSGLSTAQLDGRAAPPAPLTFINRVTMSPSVGFGPSTGSTSFITIPYPFATIHHDKACTFCGSSGGALFFDSSGNAWFSNGTAYDPAAKNGSFTISPQSEWGKTTMSTIYTITILAQNGVSRAWH